MKQYLEIKGQNPDAILFFRVGDFYEMFFEDAVTASEILQITLTSRDKTKENAVPLCGVPAHAASGYIAKLLKSGHAVAICEQVEESRGKGMMQREVARVITPGTVIEPALLSHKENHYVAALKWAPSLREIGLAYLDLSTGDFYMGAEASWDETHEELSKISPKEVILASNLSESREAHALKARWPIRLASPSFFMRERAEAALTSHFKVHAPLVLGEGIALTAAGALLCHVQTTQKGAVGNITSLHINPSKEYMRLPALTQCHLELMPLSGERQKTLLDVLDKTVTSMGGRLLRTWLLHPLISPEKITKRQEAVASLCDDIALRIRLRNLLKGISDLERLIGRISLNAAQPRDLISLKESAALLPEIQKQATPLLAPFPDLPWDNLPDSPRDNLPYPPWDNLEDVFHLIDDTLILNPPLSLKEGGLIKEGYSPELDDLRRFQKEGKSLLMRMEQAEQRRTGIDSLKIRYNQVSGYYIEVSEAHRKKIPEDYIRKQTLAHAERFTTSELMEMEAKLFRADETILSLERSAFSAVCRALSEQASRIQAMAKALALLDLLSTLAEVAHFNHYIRPQIDDSLTIRIIEGRHPVLETLDETYVPNDTLLDAPSHQLLIFTGPNMAGKSTHMRQVGLIVLMAQMGSFVPAREAVIGVVDQIFTRVGAQDNLNRGMSTFMMEMTEMAHILRHATSRSLLILDEIGRGTSTFDGMSIAWAIAEYVHSRLAARTLFATHYHELTRLSDTHKGIGNFQALVREWNDEIIFLRKIVEGGADKSYGIQVARLAGLPSEIIERAKGLLKELEEKSWIPRPAPHPPDLFLSITHPVIEALKRIDPMNLTPLEAISLLADLVKQAKGKG